MYMFQTDRGKMVLADSEKTPTLYIIDFGQQGEGMLAEMAT
jgi:hypothetical protein